MCQWIIQKVHVKRSLESLQKNSEKNHIFHPFGKYFPRNFKLKKFLGMWNEHFAQHTETFEFQISSFKWMKCFKRISCAQLNVPFTDWAWNCCRAEFLSAVVTSIRWNISTFHWKFSVKNAWESLKFLGELIKPGVGVENLLRLDSSLSSSQLMIVP